MSKRVLITFKNKLLGFKYEEEKKRKGEKNKGWGKRGFGKKIKKNEKKKKKKLVFKKIEVASGPVSDTNASHGGIIYP